MKHSTDRILTTHVGSVIRPDDLQAFLRARQGGKPYDEDAFQACLAKSVADVVRRQADAGIDVVSDGEFGKSISWAQYALTRLSGFERRPMKSEAANPFKRGADRTKFSEFYAELDAKEAVSTTMEAICVGPIAYTGNDELTRDIANFKAALKGVGVAEGFMPVAALRSSSEVAAKPESRNVSSARPSATSGSNARGRPRRFVVAPDDGPAPDFDRPVFFCTISQIIP